jgi:histidyl-tRNA synthetase
MNDILPHDTPTWQQAENIFKRVFQNYCYQEIRFPVLEKTELFNRSIGEVTDIVEKEMYTFFDKNQDSLSLRPEGTACCVRACIEHGLLYHQTQRLWYLGPYFRYERPQKGRYRQFHQCAAEVFGLAGPDIDAELIHMTNMMLDKLGIKSFTTLQINSLGSVESRRQYRSRLVQYLTKHKHLLDEDSLRRLDKNPLRILDSKNSDMKELITNAPKILDYLDDESLRHFEKLQDYLTHTGISFEINPCLVRGLDYYNKTVFEWITHHLGAQGTICAGGRYDTLVEQLGGAPTPAVGFSFGVERTILLMQQNHLQSAESHLHGYIITDSESAFVASLKLANYLRGQVPGLRLMLHCGGGSLKSQFKKADKSGATYAIIIGEHEMKTHSVSLKSLREDIPQQTLYHDELADYLTLHISKHISKNKKL